MIVQHTKYRKIDYIDRHVGNKVRLRRLSLGYSQAVIGQALNISIQQVQKYERGLNRVSCGNLYRIGKILNIPLMYFFEDVEDKIPHSAILKNNKVLLANEEREIFMLAKAYNNISRPQIKKKIIELIGTLPQTDHHLGEQIKLC